MAAQPAENFAGLIQAVVDAGVDPCVLEVLEDRGIATPLQARNFLMAGVEESELKSHLQAIVITAFGPQAITARRRPWTAFGVYDTQPASAPKKRRDLPAPQTSSGGSLTKALLAAAPENQQHSLEAFRADIFAKSNSHCHDARCAS